MIALIAFTASPAQSYDAREPLVVIRFNNPYVQYQNSLNGAVSAALKAKKDVVFDVVAGPQVQNMAGQVMRDIMSMGVQPNSINFINSGRGGTEVLVYVR